MVSIIGCWLSDLSPQIGPVSDASESYTSMLQLPTTPYHRPHSPCIHFSFLHTVAISLSSSPQPDSTPDLPSTIECISCRNKSPMCVHAHPAFKGRYLSGITQIMSLRGLSIQTRQLRRRYLRACATPDSMPSLGPTTSSAEDRVHV